METYTITLTAEECQELTRTLIGRLDLDIKNLQEIAAKQKNYKRVADLQNMYDINKSILDKIPVNSRKSLIF